MTSFLNWFNNNGSTDKTNTNSTVDNSTASAASYHTPRKNKDAPASVQELPLPLQKIGSVEIDVLYMYSKMLFEKRNLMEFVEVAAVTEDGQRYNASNLTVAALVDVIASLKLWSEYQGFIHCKTILNQQKMGMMSPQAPRKIKSPSMSHLKPLKNEKARRNIFAAPAVCPTAYTAASYG